MSSEIVPLPLSLPLLALRYQFTTDTTPTRIDTAPPTLIDTTYRPSPPTTSCITTTVDAVPECLEGMECLEDVEFLESMECLEGMECLEDVECLEGMECLEDVECLESMECLE